MFNIHSSSKRTKLAIRFFTYGVMTVASVVLTVLLVFVALGYRLDRNFTFSQGGLLQFRSFPQGAAIILDGKLQSYHTPDKDTVSAGQHTVTMSLSGYRPWSKTIDLAPGQLLWLNYARLIPNSITTSTQKEYPSIAATLPSPDHRWYLMLMNKQGANFTLVDNSDENKPRYTSLDMPDGLLTKKDGKAGSIEMVEWDLQSKYILLKHTNGETVEFVRVDRSKPGDAVNLTKVFGLDIKEAHFSGNDPNIIFAKNGDVLRRLDVGSSSASAALVTGLRDFTVYGEDTIAFTSVQEVTSGGVSTQEQQIGVYRQGKTTIVRSVPADKKVHIAYNEYDNHYYLAIGTSDSTKVDIVRDASATGSSKNSNIFAQFDLGHSVDWVSVSSSGRLIVAQHGKDFVAYDIETAKAYNKMLEFGSDDMAHLKWLDDYYLWTDTGGVLRIFEFDGTNDHEITTLSPGYTVMLSASGKHLFSIGANNSNHQQVLQSSKLTTD